MLLEAFATMINHELTINIDLQQFERLGLVKYTSCQFDYIRQRVLDGPLSAKLPDYSWALSLFVHRIVDELISFHPQDTALDTVRDRYQDDIVSVIASPSGFRECQRILSGIPEQFVSWWDRDFKRWFQAYVERKDLKAKDLAAAAAATENLDALKRYKKGIFYTEGDTHPFTFEEDFTFANCLHAAAWNGKIKSIRFLLQQLDTTLAEKQPSIRQTEFEWTFSDLVDSISVAIEQGHNEFAKVLIEFVTRHDDTFLRFESQWDIFISQNTYSPVAVGNVEIFEFVNTLSLYIDDKEIFEEALRDGFNSACRNGHAGMVEHILQSGYKEFFTRFYHHSYWEVYWKGESWGDIHVNDPLIFATGYSNIQVMEVLLKHGFAVKATEDILEAAVLGIRVSDNIYPERTLPRLHFRKSGSRFKTLQFLLGYEDLIPMDRSDVHLVNQLAKFIHTNNEGWLCPDVCMTMILLLDMLKSSFGRGDSLRKNVHRGVTRVLRRVIDTRLDMPSTQYDFLGMAAELYAWLPRIRSLVAKKPKALEL